MNFTPVRDLIIETAQTFSATAGDTLGYSCLSDKNLFFFGTEMGSPEALGKTFCDFKFARVKQVHGNNLVEIKKDNFTPLTADALWTQEHNIAITVATADCLPILVSHADFICAIHAGWRGIQNEIIVKTLKSLLTKFDKEQSTTLVIGPHIQQNSFEVDLDLALSFQELSDSYGGPGRSIFIEKKTKSNKAFVDLRHIAIQQIMACGLLLEQISEFSADTQVDTRFASYRRQKASATRNLSFVTRLYS